MGTLKRLDRYLVAARTMGDAAKREATQGGAMLPFERGMVDQVVSVRHRAVTGAAQFVLRHKRQLHRAGMVDFDLPEGVDLPPWAAIVFDTLRLRPRSWRVVVKKGRKGKRSYRLEWVNWMRWARRPGKR